MLGLHPLIFSLSRFGSYLSVISDTDFSGSKTLLKVLEHFELILDCMMLQSFPNDRYNWPTRSAEKGSNKYKAAGDLDDKDEGIVAESSDEEIAKQEI